MPITNGRRSLGPAKAQTPSVGKCQGVRQEGVGGQVGEHPHRREGRGMGWEFMDVKPGRKIIFEM